MRQTENSLNVVVATILEVRLGNLTSLGGSVKAKTAEQLGEKFGNEVDASAVLTRFTRGVCHAVFNNCVENFVEKMALRFLSPRESSRLKRFAQI
jgi:hypothetical protein